MGREPSIVEVRRTAVEFVIIRVAGQVEDYESVWAEGVTDTHTHGQCEKECQDPARFVGR